MTKPWAMVATGGVVSVAAAWLGFTLWAILTVPSSGHMEGWKFIIVTSPLWIAAFFMIGWMVIDGVVEMYDHFKHDD